MGIQQIKSTGLELTTHELHLVATALENALLRHNALTKSAKSHGMNCLSILASRFRQEHRRESARQALLRRNDPELELDYSAERPIDQRPARNKVYRREHTLAEFPSCRK